MLALTDLLQDANGEVVLFNDSGLRSLALSTDALVVAEGQATRHVTAAGEDVSGFRYVAFDNGLKLFYQPGLDLVLGRRRRLVEMHHGDAVDHRKDAAVTGENAVDELGAVLEAVKRRRHQLELSAAVRTPEHRERVQSHSGIIGGRSRDLRILGF